MEFDLIEETLRYAGVKGTPDEALRSAARKCQEELTAALEPKWVWRSFSLSPAPDGIVAEGAELLLPGAMAKRMLGESTHAVFLVCTLGRRFDALMRAAQIRDMTKALLLDACGSAYVEQGCDAAERELSGRFPGKFLTDRFSPGYGDLPLALQPRILAVLDAERRLGVTVTDSLLMIPAKTVTAVIGLADTPQPARVRGCAYCMLRDECEYRKGGTSCERRE